jgi:amino acid transporter
MPSHKFHGVKHSGAAPQEALGVLGLLAVCYTASISGSYGLEAAVSAGGPLLTILSLLIIPVFWGVPTALSIAELSCAIPSNAGPTMWVNVAFSTIVTGAVTYITLFLNFVDNSLYPTVFADYCRTVFHLDGFETKSLKVIFIWCAALVNMVGVEFVGGVSVFIMVATMAPFALMLLIQLPHGFDWERITEVPETVNWALFLPVVCWNFSGFDSAGNVTEEVRDKPRVIPRALGLLVIAGVATYIPPVLVGASVPALKGLDWKDWDDGFWVKVGHALGGNMLAHVVLVGSSISTFGMMTAMLATTSRSLAGTGQIGFFPDGMSTWLSRYHVGLRTPVNSIIVNCVVTTILCLTSGFEDLVEADQILYALRLAAIMAAFLKLRYSYPRLHRPYSVPGGTVGAVLCGGVPMLFSLGLVAVSMLSSPITAVVGVAIIAGSFAGSYLMFGVWRQGIAFSGQIVTNTSFGSESARSDASHAAYSCVGSDEDELEEGEMVVKVTASGQLIVAEV